MAKVPQRALLIFVLVLLLSLSFAPQLLADKKSTERLVYIATNDLVPQIRRAASEAIVAGFILTGRPLDQLEGPAREAIAKRGYHELQDAITAGRNGNYIDICYCPQKIQDYYVPSSHKHLSQMSMEELRRLVEIGHVSTAIKQAAAQLLVQREIASVHVQFTSFYRFRTQHETLFDVVKSQLEKWAVGSMSEILQDATVESLAKMYLAEHFLTLPYSMIAKVVDCHGCPASPKSSGEAGGSGSGS